MRVGNRRFRAHYRPFWELVNRGEWEPETFKVFDRFLDGDHSFLDIGAWIGPTTLYGSKLAKSCYSFEPDPVAFEELKRNVSLNPGIAEKINLQNSCIWNKNGQTTLGSESDPGDSMSSVMFEESERSFDVECTTLQSFLRENKIEDCNFIKMDIEGGEAIVLPSIKDYLKAEKPTIQLSIHPQFFPDRREMESELSEIMGAYRNIYSISGEQLSIKDVMEYQMQLDKASDLVFTDEKW